MYAGINITQISQGTVTNFLCSFVNYKINITQISQGTVTLGDESN